MSENNIREHKRKRSYTFIVVSDTKSKGTRSFSISRGGFYGLFITFIILIVGFTLSVIIFTPIGTKLPISNPELTRIYGKRIFDLQRQLKLLIQEVEDLRGYNLQLRKVLGENVDQQSLARNEATDSSEVNEYGKSDYESVDSLVELLPDEAERGYSQIVTNSRINTQEFEGLKYRPEVYTVPFIVPVSGFESREYSPENYHYGIDYAGKPGTPVQAAADGIVVFSDWTYEDGFKVILAHPQGFLTVYKHNNAVLKFSCRLT
jgi:murein DD-endopeptidase MepM/ murein hydrolase activator NlpD